MIAVAHAPLGRGRMISTGVLLGVAAVLVLALLASAGSDRLAADFHESYLDAAGDVRAGNSPYANADAFPYLYPPLLAELVVPLTFLPENAASMFALVVSIAAVMGAVALVGVRDVRCFAAVAIWAPTWNAFEMANITAVLALLAALVWRYREERWRSAGVLGASLALKLVLGPLVVWAAATRRLGTAVLASAVALALTLASWAAIGFAGLTSYSDRIHEFSFAKTYSLVGITAALGVDPIVGHVAMLGAGAALLIAVAVLGRRGDETRAFTCAIVAALVLSPVVWLHYLALLVVPLGISRPNFAPIWLLPIVLWVCPRDGHGDAVQPYIPAVVVAMLFVVLMTQPRDGRRMSEVHA